MTKSSVPQDPPKNIDDTPYVPAAWIDNNKHINREGIYINLEKGDSSRSFQQIGHFSESTNLSDSITSKYKDETQLFNYNKKKLFLMILNEKLLFFFHSKVSNKLLHLSKKSQVFFQNLAIHIWLC